MIDTKVFLDRRGVCAFGLGCAAVTIGVLLHLPMFWMGHKTGFVLAGMTMVDLFFPCRSVHAITSIALPYGDLTPLSRPPRNGC